MFLSEGAKLPAPLERQSRRVLKVVCFMRFLSFVLARSYRLLRLRQLSKDKLENTKVLQSQRRRHKLLVTISV